MGASPLPWAVLTKGFCWVSAQHGAKPGSNCSPTRSLTSSSERLLIRPKAVSDGIRRTGLWKSRRRSAHLCQIWAFGNSQKGRYRNGKRVRRGESRGVQKALTLGKTNMSGADLGTWCVENWPRRVGFWFQLQCVCVWDVGFTPPSHSSTPAECPIIQLHSDSTRPGTASSSTG